MYQATTKCYYRGYVIYCAITRGKFGGYLAAVSIDRGDVRNPSSISYAPRHVLFQNENEATYFVLHWAERRIDNLSASDLYQLGNQTKSSVSQRK
ncbi:hypothetical protein P3T20_003822 [Paraburkholderia sp. GAS206C]|jgi:hypothetical protein